jgi:hypothetical protein
MRDPFDLGVGEDLFSNERCRVWWRIKFYLNARCAPAWPEMTAAWYARDLEEKREAARMCQRQRRAL